MPDVVHAERIARPVGPRGFRRVVAAIGLLYVATIFLAAAGVRADKVLPRPFLYFAQIADLFPDEATVAIEYRAEGFVCAEGKYREIDERVLFAIHRDDKENKFFRAMSFYHSPDNKSDGKVMKALADYIVREYDKDPSVSPIGGVMLLSLREPIAAPGEHVPRFRRTPLVEHAISERHPWHVTSPAAAAKRCAELGHPVPADTPAGRSLP